MIKDVIICILNNYRNNPYSKNITFTHEVPAADLTIYADKFRIHQVISNLVDNSKFSYENGSILIKAESKLLDINNGNSKKENVVVISVRDNGVRIDSEIIDKLFTKFTTNSFQGIGLGIYLAKITVEVHGGRIWA